MSLYKPTWSGQPASYTTWFTRLFSVGSAGTGRICRFAWIHLFAQPVMQSAPPRQARFVFQLDRFDERTALCALINLAKKVPAWSIELDGMLGPVPFQLLSMCTCSGAFDQHPKAKMGER